jgi:hypothetical protein
MLDYTILLDLFKVFLLQERLFTALETPKPQAAHRFLLMW